MKSEKLFLLFLILASSLHAVIPEKILICGVGKNIQETIPVVISSAENLGNQFLDYRVIIYENNSKDKSRKMLSKWAYRNDRVIFLSEYLTKAELAQDCVMGVPNRTELIARARNKVLDVVMRKDFTDFKYVLWADLDLKNPWDIENILKTILYPEQEWDAVLANGAYDLFALRDREFPIGFELIGDEFFYNIDSIRTHFHLDRSGPWRSVYSAFGGLGIYKRSSIKRCRYSGVVTKDLERVVTRWLEQAYQDGTTVCFLDIYSHLLDAMHPIDLYKKRLSPRHRFPEHLGLRLHNDWGLGKIVWFSCTQKATLPWTCEHIPFHASMILRGHDKIFINPRLISQ